MAAELSLLSFTQLQNLSQHPAPNSWEAAWPPRSYTCTFCHREFRSAQALGGHMNVHRRERARLHQSPPQGPDPSFPTTLNPPIIIPSPEFVAGSGLCFFYPIQSSGDVFAPASGNPTTLLPLLNLLPNKGNGDVKDGKHGSDGMVAKEVDLELRLGW